MVFKDEVGATDVGNLLEHIDGLGQSGEWGEATMLAGPGRLGCRFGSHTFTSAG